MFRQVVATYLADYPQMYQSLEVQIREVAEKIGKELIAFTNLPVEPLKEVRDTATFRTPKTWFQHFKQSCFPKWLLKRFPVDWHEEKIEVILNVGAAYPKLPEVFPKHVGEIRYAYTKNSPISSYPIGNDGEYTF